MVLLIRGGTLDKSKTAAAVRATFMKRATHDVPKELIRRQQNGNRCSMRWRRSAIWRWNFGKGLN